MKSLINIFSLCCLISIANVANAQQLERDFQLEAQLGLSHVLGLGGVSKELEMDSDQRFELSDLWSLTQMRLQDSFKKFEREFGESLPDSEIEALKERLQSEIAEIREWELEQLKIILKDEQIERLRQIKFQYLTRNSPAILGLKDELELSPSQVKQIKSILEQMHKDSLDHEKTARDLKMPPADIEASILEIRKNALDDLLAVLDDSQQSKLERLQGKPFEFQDGNYVAPEAEEGEDGKEKDAADKESIKGSGDDGVQFNNDVLPYRIVRTVESLR